VSIAALISGILIHRFLDNLVFVETFLGRISEYLGRTKTSSKVSLSSIEAILDKFFVIANSQKASAICGAKLINLFDKKKNKVSLKDGDL
jgi:hypothetical protein